MSNTNPYRAALRLGEIKLPGQDNPAFDKSGEINASSVKDAKKQVAQVIATAAQGGMIGSMTSKERAELIATRQAVLADAVSSKAKFEVLGAAMTADVYETTNRDGFARRILQFKEVPVGGINEIEVIQKQVMGFEMVSPTEALPSEVRGRTILPPEFNITAYILVDLMEIARATSDLLGRAYDEGLEQTMVVEDRAWRGMAMKAATVRNRRQMFQEFTPRVFARFLNQVNQWGIPPAACLFDSSMWQDFIAGDDFQNAYDPVTKWQVLQTGYLGSMYGVALMSDTFRQPNLRVLQNGEVFLVGAPEHHGVITVRGDVLSEAIDKFDDGVAKRGWFLNQITSMNVVNALSVAYGRRI